MMHLKKGHKFHGPNGHGYELTRDIQTGDALMAEDFYPFGGAPDPVAGHPMPGWMEDAIEAAHSEAAA